MSSNDVNVQQPHLVCLRPKASSAVRVAEVIMQMIGPEHAQRFAAASNLGFFKSRLSGNLKDALAEGSCHLNGINDLEITGDIFRWPMRSP